MVLVKRGNKWALVSKENRKKVLKWFGPKKPSPKAVLKEERRVQFFKALRAGKIPRSKIRKKGLIPVKRHRRKNRMVKAHLRKRK